METEMVSNEWLWQPRKGGPIHLRITYTDSEGKRRGLTRSLRTNNWTTARKIRDTEFKPIILDMDKAIAQLEVIQTLYPQLEAQLQAGKHGGYAEEKPKAPITTLSAAIEAWAKEIATPNGNYAIAPKTAGRYKSIAERFCELVGEGVSIDAVTKEQVAEYRDMRLTDQGKVKKTIDLELTGLRSLFRYAIDKYGLTSNPAEGVVVRRTKAERKRENRPSRRPPTLAEADILCSKFPSVHRAHPVIDFEDYSMFARYSGMRQGEIAQITVADIVQIDVGIHVNQILQNPREYCKPFKGELKTGQLPCLLVLDRDGKTTKTGEERVVPIATKLLPVIQRRISKRSKGPIFPFAAKDNGSSFGRLWLKKAKKVHDDITMHGFRHYAISSMENNGANPAVCRLIVGHHDATVHGDYLHHTVAALHEAIEKIV